jgi:hypothetical protein
VTGVLAAGKIASGLDKYPLAYLYINAVFLYIVRRGWPLSGLAAIFSCSLFSVRDA